MGLRTSTGQGTRVRHSTGLEWDELKKARTKYTPARQSTGESSKIRHSTSTEMGYRALRGEEEEKEADTDRKTHSIPAKAQEDTKYLDLYLNSKRRKASSHRQAVSQELGDPGEGAEEVQKAALTEQFKTISRDY